MRLRFFKKILLAGMVVASPNAVSAEILGIQYEGFKIWIDCETKSAIRWKYTARKNRGNYRPSERYFQSPDIPSRCQQTSVNAYQTKREQVKYVRGQLVPAKAMNSNKIALKQTNTMTNVLPQVEQMNRGAWRETEAYVSCRRNKEPITVVGGVYQGAMPRDGDFMISHDIVAPEAYWKVAYGSKDIIAWWVPNSTKATKENIDKYIVTASEIEQRIGQEIDVPYFLKNKRARSSNVTAEQCQWR